MPRIPSGKPRHDPLIAQLNDDQLREKYGKLSQPGLRKKSRRGSADEDHGDTILDSKTSKRIFDLAKDQQEELDALDDDDEDVDVYNAQFSSHRAQNSDSDDDDVAYEGDSGEDVDNNFQLDPADMETMDALMPASSGNRKTLADIIFSKIEAEGGNVSSVRNSRQNHEHPDPALGLDPKVVETFTKVGLFLQKYKSGPLPKVFKVIPSLPAWARMLALTHPENWSAHACLAATRIFISNMKPPQAQLFTEVVLLDAIRDDIAQNKKLNVHYYEALKRALYKPSAFFKGLVFPLLDVGCTLREAAIVASVLAKKKVPVLHSSAALLRIAEMDYTGPNSLFIRVLVDKKHQLPYKVVDALVFHFIRLSNTYKARNRGETDKLPVLWHQSLLAFCQRYASDLTSDQKDALLDVVRATPHPQIGPEIRRELVNSVARGEPRPDIDQDVVMS